MITLCPSNSIDLNVNSYKVYPANISISDQFYSNVDPTLKIKTKSDVGFSTLHNVDTTTDADVETTLKRRRSNVVQR